MMRFCCVWGQMMQKTVGFGGVWGRAHVLLQVLPVHKVVKADVAVRADGQFGLFDFVTLLHHVSLQLC